MKIRINKLELNKALSTVGRVVGGRGNLPVLSCVLIESDKDNVSFLATNMDIGMRYIVKCEGHTNKKAVAIPYKNLSEFVASLPEGEVQIEIKDGGINVSSEGMNADFLGISADEFPKFGVGFDETVGIKIDKRFVERLCGNIAFSCASDESRPVLTGVKINNTKGKVVAVGSDGFRMSREEYTSDLGEFFEKGMVIPSKTLFELSRAFGDTTVDKIEMVPSKDGGQIMFGFNNMQLVSRVLSGNFPDVEKVIPQEFKTSVIFDRDEMLRGVKALSIFARDNNNILRLEIDGGVIKLSAASSGSGSGVVEIEGKTEGSGIKVAFNFRYLSEYLNGLKSGLVEMKLNGSESACVFVEKDTKNSYIHLIMPVRVQDH